MLDLEKKYKLSTDIVIRGVGEKYWALNIRNGKQYRLNKTAFSILNALHMERTLMDIVNILKSEYIVDDERVIDDCNVVIPFAIEKQIIREVV